MTLSFSGKSTDIRLFPFFILLFFGLFTSCVSTPEEAPPVEVVEVDLEKQFKEDFISFYELFQWPQEIVLTTAGVAVPLDSFLLNTAPDMDPVPEGVIFLGKGRVGDYAGKNVSGECVFIRPEEDELFLAAYQAFLWGAEVIVISPRSLPRQLVGEFSVNIPLFILSPEAGDELEMVLKEGAEVLFSINTILKDNSNLEPFNVNPRMQKALSLAVASSAWSLLREDSLIFSIPAIKDPNLWIEALLRMDSLVISLPPKPQLELIAGAEWGEELKKALLNWKNGLEILKPLVDELYLRSDSINRALFRDSHTTWMNIEAEALSILSAAAQLAEASSVLTIVQTLREASALLENGGDPLTILGSIPGAHTIPNYSPEAVSLWEGRTFSTPNTSFGGWSPQLNDLFLGLALGFDEDEASRKAMVQELEFWEAQGQIYLLSLLNSKASELLSLEQRLTQLHIRWDSL